MTSSLENLAGAGKPLAAEPADANEIAGLLRSGRARLADAKIDTLSLDSRFDLAYNAAHAFGLAALRRHGYRARHRYIVFQVLPNTLGLGPEVWRGDCPRFCINGPLAGNCRNARRCNDHSQARGTRRAVVWPVG